MGDERPHALSGSIDTSLAMIVRRALSAERLIPAEQPTLGHKAATTRSPALSLTPRPLSRASPARRIDRAMNRDQLLDEAQSCRRLALAYVGNAEAPFLLRVADAFERLAQTHAQSPANREDRHIAWNLVSP